MFIKLLLKNSLPNCFNSTPLKIKMNIKLKSNIFSQLYNGNKFSFAKEYHSFQCEVNINNTNS